ncbi:uncharacterized protein LOC116423993 [Nomia melanderi]|uniref:uncharacterized protein LOC116423993 n=1 Tax=Nomia melanderi TaxID=2448451 RepID=UPI001303F52A|nr:uncharacterized protein LOC116423993 [Nomia melanderi]
MSGECNFEDWKISLGMRNNLMYADIPYIPILVEDIPIYVSFKDYQENGVKTIQTLGELVPQSETRAALVSLTPGNNSKISVCLKNLSFTDIYIKDTNDVYCAVWDKHIAFKVYGVLNSEESTHVLKVKHLVPIHDVVGTQKIMTFFIRMARSEYRQYYRTQGQNTMLQLQWDKMNEQRERMVNEDE